MRRTIQRVHVERPDVGIAGNLRVEREHRKRSDGLGVGTIISTPGRSDKAHLLPNDVVSIVEKIQRSRFPCPSIEKEDIRLHLSKVRYDIFLFRDLEKGGSGTGVLFAAPYIL